MENSSQKPLTIESIAIFLILALIWGSSFIMMKQGLKVFSAGQVGALRIATAFVVFLPFALRDFDKIKPSKWKFLFLAGACGNLLPAFLFAAAQTQLNSSLVGILNGLTPIFAFLVGIIFFRQALRANQVFGVMLGFVGSVVIGFLRNDGNWGEINYFALLVVLATCLYGINVNLIRTFLADLPPLTISAGSLFAVGFFALAYLLSGDFLEIVRTHPQAPNALLYIALLGAAGSAFALVLFNRLVQTTSAVFASSVTYLIPVVAISWGVFDHEPFTLYHVIGVSLIIGGVYSLNKRR